MSRPSWDEVWARIGSEEMLAAKALIELSWDMRVDAEQWTSRDEHGEPQFDWPEWVASVETDGRGWSSTTTRLFPVVAALLDPEREVPLVRCLSYTGSWETEFWQILVNWGSGGNNRDLPGRLRVTPRS